LDIYVSILEQDAQNTSHVLSKFQQATQLQAHVKVLVTPNRGGDMGQFLTQMHHVVNGIAAAKNKTQLLGIDVDTYYQAFLKVHAKTSYAWRRRLLESLCGSTNHVLSILSTLSLSSSSLSLSNNTTATHTFHKNHDHDIHDHQNNNNNIQMIAPLGTTFGPNTPIENIYPTIVETYGMTSTQPAFDPKTLQRMDELYSLVTATTKSSPQHYDSPNHKLPHARIVAGSCFWHNWQAFPANAWARIYPQIYPQMTPGYVQNHGVEHILERVFPSMLAPRSIAEITPAPRVFAFYFPQFHAIPENDRFWGTNFTEWTLLKPLKGLRPRIRKPLPIEKGGLGYYSLLDFSTRQRQAALAKQYGVTGFCFYHYWFSGDHAPAHHVVMPGVLDAMMRDGQPSVPFMLSWANEPWNKRWTGEAKTTDSVLLSQEYGTKDEWREHFLYLLPFFQHPLYERVENGKPVFSIYRLGHVGKVLAPMIRLWQQLAHEHGLPGIHFIQTVGNFYKTDKTYRFIVDKNGDNDNAEEKVVVDASAHFWPQLIPAFTSGKRKKYKVQFEKGQAASIFDVPLALTEQHNRHHVQYWGAYTSFDRRPRDNKAHFNLVHPRKFDQGLHQSFAAMSAYSQRRIDKNLFFVTAWNEWNEQALLEPDDEHEFGYLEALQKNLRSVPVHVVTDDPSSSLSS